MAKLVDILAKNRDFEKTVTPSLLVGVSETGEAHALSVDALGNLVTAGGSVSALSIIHSVYRNYTTQNVTTSAWFELISSTAGTIKKIKVDDTSGQVLELGVGAAGSEVHLCFIPRGGIDSGLEVVIQQGARVCVRAVSGVANSGELIMEMLG